MSTMKSIKELGFIQNILDFELMGGLHLQSGIFILWMILHFFQDVTKTVSWKQQCASPLIWGCECVVKQIILQMLEVRGPDTCVYDWPPGAVFLQDASSCCYGNKGHWVSMQVLKASQDCSCVYDTNLIGCWRWHRIRHYCSHPQISLLHRYT